MNVCKFCGCPVRPEHIVHTPSECISALQDRVEALEQERDAGIAAMTQLQLGAVAERERIERERDRARDDLGAALLELSVYREVWPHHWWAAPPLINAVMWYLRQLGWEVSQQTEWLSERGMRYDLMTTEQAIQAVQELRVLLHQRQATQKEASQ